MVEKKKKTRSTSSSVDPATQYARDVDSGKEIAGPDIRNSCKRHLRDLEDVYKRQGGISSLEAELERRFECQYPHGSWHSENFTLFRHEPGSIRLCWACDNLVRDQYTETVIMPMSVFTTT